MSAEFVRPATAEPSTQSERETAWLAATYRPSEPNLTVRAVVVGMLIGAAMCLSNLYVFFKTGWSMGVTLTACILAFGAFQALQAARIVKKPLGVLENNALTTVASGAGYMTGGGNMAAFGALLMVTTFRPEPLPMVAWFGLIAALGVFAAIPIKRQLINQEGLAFPTGTATAETIRSIHDAAAGAGASKAAWLGWSAVGAAVLTWFRDAWHWIPTTLGLPLTLAGRSLAEWTLSLKAEVVLIGGGALMSFRTGWSLLLGGLLTYAVLAPSLLSRGIIDSVSYKAIVAWTLWPGAAILVASGLTSFALDYKSIARSFTGLTQIFRRRQAPAASGISAVECPEWWFPTGFIVLGPFVVALMVWLFQIPVWAGVIAVPLAVVMGFVAARVTGETDVTPTKALGPVTQLIYGVITPGNLSGNIMSANVTGGVGLHAADLLTTLKTGWLLGAKPRHQFYAQLFGVLAGAAIVVPAFNLILPDPSVLGGEAWPAPSCVVWAGVSKAFSGGIGALHSTAKTAILVGLALGTALALMEKFAPRRLRTVLPSPAGLGIAMVIPGSNAIAMFLGAAAAEWMRRKFPVTAEKTVVPVASGLIAGESLMGILIALLIVTGVLAA
ncbi:OPT family oligopeptide transporter [Opitutus terrae]|uniref:Oligopeptide transporter, OPT superfamily n=1 Tax=Opitutus terrae (strain DSM 11246 / JCM 15787 / PB90-1) TaxID=452637 RepID=B2A0C8_OPITP|nr:OPT family oligopeptide transporter [Opitutus terrae]ACB77882.1 oligopeptide transporter, OPT superfamily [Opitutus terrae PB90-1]